MISTTTKFRLFALKGASVLARALFCLLTLIDFLLIAYVSMLCIEGGSRSVAAWVAHIGRSSGVANALGFTLLCAVLGASTLAAWRLQARLTRNATTAVIVADVTSAIPVGDEQFAQEIRVKLTERLSKLPGRRPFWMVAARKIQTRFGLQKHRSEPQCVVFSASACWETANLLLRTEAQKRSPEYRGDIDRRREGWRRETGKRVVGYRHPQAGQKVSR